MLSALKELKRHVGKTLRLVAIEGHARTSYCSLLLEINGSLFTMINDFQAHGLQKMLDRFVKTEGFALFWAMTRRPATLEKMPLDEKEDIMRILLTIRDEFKRDITEDMLNKLKKTPQHFKRLINCNTLK